MPNDNINLGTTPYSGDAEEPYAKKPKLLKNLMLAGKQVNVSERADGSNENVVSVGDESSQVPNDGQPNPNQKAACKDVGLTGSSFIGPLCQQEIVERKIIFEDELDKFYKELEQIAPEDVDTLDDCYTDKSAIVQKQQSPVSQQEIQPDFSQPIRHHEPHSGQLLQNKPQNLAHLQPHYQDWAGSCRPPSKHSNSPCWGYMTHTRSQRPLYRCPPPFLPPPPRIPHPLYDDVSRHNFRDQNQETFCWENIQISSSYMPTNQGDNHVYQYNYKTIPTEFSCNESTNSQPPCSQPHGQTSSFCQRTSEEYKTYEKANPPPGQTADPYSLKLILMRGAPGSGKSTLARCVKVFHPSTI